MELLIIKDRVEKIKELNSDIKAVEQTALEIKSDEKIQELITKEYFYKEGDLSRVVVNDKAAINECFNKYLRPLTDLKKKVYDWYKLFSENEKMVKDLKDKCLKLQENARIKTQREMQERMARELQESQQVVEREEYTLDDQGELIVETTKEIDLSLQIAKQEEIDKQLKTVKIIKEKLTKDMISVELNEIEFINANDISKLLELGVLKVDVEKLKGIIAKSDNTNEPSGLKGFVWNKKGDFECN